MGRLSDHSRGTGRQGNWSIELDFVFTRWKRIDCGGDDCPSRAFQDHDVVVVCILLVQDLHLRHRCRAALSPDALKSDRVKHETTTAINLESENKLIGTIPLMVKPCEIPSDLETKRFISFVDNSKFNTCFKELMSTLEKE